MEQQETNFREMWAWDELIFSQYVTNSQYIAFKIDGDQYSGIILTEKE